MQAVNILMQQIRNVLQRKITVLFEAQQISEEISNSKLKISQMMQKFGILLQGLSKKQS